MAKRACSICCHSDCAAIDVQLASGVFQSDIAEKFRVSRFAVSRHARHSVSTVSENETDSLEAQARKWRMRADTLWTRSEIDQDSRAAAQALAAGLRSCELQARHEQRETEATSEADAGAISIQQIDRLFEEHGAKLLAEIESFVAQRARNRRSEDELPISQKH